MPRFTIFRSGKHIYAQIIDDSEGKTLVASSDLKIARRKNIDNNIDSTPKRKTAFTIGEEIAKKAVAKKIKTVVFDRGGYKYHGRLKALADGAREGGLVF